MDITVGELRSLRDAVLADPLSQEDAVKVFVKWFGKKAERILTTAAKFGYSVATLDLPVELSLTLSKETFKPLLTQVKALLPGASFCIVEEEYEGKTLYRLEVRW